MSINLVTNGNFDTQKVSGVANIVPATITGWTKSQTTGIGLINKYYYSYSNQIPYTLTQGCFFDPSTTVKFDISQNITFPTTGDYVLSFFAKNTNSTNKLTVSVASISQSIYNDVYDYWIRYRIPFYVSGTGSQLKITRELSSDTNKYPFITGVSIVKDTTNLVTNGYFTSYVFPITATNWTLTGYTETPDTNFGYREPGSGVEPPTPMPFEIKNYAFFRASGSAINQTISFPSSGNYVLTYWATIRLTNSVGTLNMVFNISGTSIQSLKIPITSQWNKYRVPFYITAASQTLSISTYETSYTGNGVILSGISITAAETPTSNILLNAATGAYDATLLSDSVPTVDTTNTKLGASSLALNATNQQYTQLNDFRVPSTGLTIACWFKYSSAGWTRVFDFGNGENNDNILYSPNNGTAYYIGTTSYLTQAATGKADNAWHHFVWTMTFAPPYSKTSTHTVYLDNVAVYTSSTQYYPKVGPRSCCYLGRSNFASDPYATGNIDDFRVYDKPLSAIEASELYSMKSTSLQGMIKYSLANYYTFETNHISGTSVANLASGNLVYDATLYNNPTITTADKKVGSSCLSLNDTLYQYVKINSIVVTTAGFTVASWFKYSSDGYARLFHFAPNSSGNSDAFGYCPGNGTFLYIGGTSQPGLDAKANNRADNVWHHFVWTMTYAASGSATSTHVIYIDGNAVATITEQKYPNVGARNYSYIGVDSPTSGNATGLVDDFRVYNNVLTSNDVTTLYNSTSTITYSGDYTLGLVNTAASTAVYDASLNGGAYINTQNYPTGTGSVAFDTSGQYVRINNRLITGRELTFAFWARGSNGCGINTLLDYSNGPGGNNRISFGLQNNSPYAQVVNGTGIKTPTFVNSVTAFTATSSGIHSLCGTSDGTRITYSDYGNGNVYTYIYANSTWSLSGTLSVGSQPVGTCCTADGSRLVISRRIGTLLYATWNGTVYENATATGFGQTTSDGCVSMTPDGKILVFARGHTTGNDYVYLSVWNSTASNYNVFTQFSTTGRWFGVDITPDGSRVAYTDLIANTAYYSVWNNVTQTFGNQTAITTVNGSIRCIAFSKDGNLLFLGNKNTTASTGFQYAIWNGSAFSSFYNFPSGVIPTSFDNTGIVIGWDNTVYISQYGNANILKFSFQVANQYTATNFYSTQNLNDGLWRHYAWTIDVSNATYKYYLNGSLIKTDTTTTVFPAQTTRTIGLLGTSTDLSLSYFIGAMDDYRVYNSVLTDTQINDVMSGKVFGNGNSDLKKIFRPYSKGIQINSDTRLLGVDSMDNFQPYTSGTKAAPTGVYVLRGGVMTDMCHVYQPY